MTIGLCRTNRTATFATVLLCAAAIWGAPSHASAYTFDDVEVTYWTGLDAGPDVNEALLVIDWQEPGQDSMVFGYRWNGEATGLDMLTAVDQVDSRFHLEWHANYPVVYGLGWDADGDGFSESDTDDYYAAGWIFDGFWRYYLSDDAENWPVSEFGAGGRDLSDGDWDGWSWAPDFFSSEPDNLPEASTTGDTPGDTNGDGVVDEIDYANMLAQFGATPGPNSADFNGDDIVDLADFAILRGNLGSSGAPGPHLAVGPVVPEPTTLALLAMGAGALLARRGNKAGLLSR